MKLSQLEALCMAMRETAQATGATDPNVEFYEASRSALMNAACTGAAFLNMEPDVEGHPLSDFMVLQNGDAAQRGDFAIPMRLC